MSERIIIFTLIVFQLEDNIKEIFIDYIEDESEFLSIDFRKVRKNHWLCKLILKSKNIKKKYLKKINYFPKNFKLSNLRSVNDDNINIGQIYFEEFENKDWLGKIFKNLSQLILKILLFMIVTTLKYLIQRKNY